MQQTGIKRIKNEAWFGWKGDPLGIVQEIKFWLYSQYMRKQEPIQEN